jgi:hypothetical protein
MNINLEDLTEDQLEQLEKTVERARAGTASSDAYRDFRFRHIKKQLTQDETLFDMVVGWINE